MPACNFSTFSRRVRSSSSSKKGGSALMFQVIPENGAVGCRRPQLPGLSIDHAQCQCCGVVGNVDVSSTSAKTVFVYSAARGGLSLSFRRSLQLVPIDATVKNKLGQMHEDFPKLGARAAVLLCCC